MITANSGALRALSEPWFLNVKRKISKSNVWFIQEKWWRRVLYQWWRSSIMTTQGQQNIPMHNVLKVFSFQTQRNLSKKKKKANRHTDCLLRLFCKRKSISSSLGCSYTISLFLKSFCSSSINSFPFHCRNTRGPSQRQLCYWLLSFKQWWSSMSEGSIPAAYENDVRVCAVQWGLPRPISCIHHRAPMVVRSPVNAMVFTHSGSLSTRLY